MTYKIVGKEWIGFCDGCNFPFKPIVLNYCEYYIKNKSREHFHSKVGKKPVAGYCEGCCGKSEGPGHNLFRNIKDGILVVKIVKSVSVV